MEDIDEKNKIYTLSVACPDRDSVYRSCSQKDECRIELVIVYLNQVKDNK